MLGGSAFGLTGFLLFSSYHYIPTGIATVFHFTTPLFVHLILFFVFRERLPVKIILSILSALIGLFAVFYSVGDLAVAGIICAAASGFTNAVYMISIERSGYKDINGFIVVFYMTLFSGLFFTLLSFFKYGFIFSGNRSFFAYSFLTALLCTVLPSAFVTKGIQLIGSSKGSVLSLLEPLTSVILGAVFLDESLNKFSMMGIFIVLCSIVFAAGSKREV